MSKNVAICLYKVDINWIRNVTVHNVVFNVKFVGVVKVEKYNLK